MEANNLCEDVSRQEYKRCLNIEKDGEELFFPAFNEYLKNRNCLLKKHTTFKMQQSGDYTVINNNTHRKFTIDRKHELKESSNIFFEIFSNRISINNKPQKLGWGLKEDIDYILYSFNNHNMFPLINMKKLRKYIGIINNQINIQNKYGNEYVGKYRIISQNKYNQKNLTQGLLIPFKTIHHCIDKMLKINNDGIMIDCDYSEFLKIAIKKTNMY